MKTHTFESMQEVLETKDISVEDLAERINILSEYQFSIILEGVYIEFDCLDTWIKHNYEAGTILNIFYRKTGYDYGFAEYFTKDKLTEEKLREIISSIYFEGFDRSTEKIIVIKTYGYQNYIERPIDDKAALMYDDDTGTITYLSGQEQDNQ